MKKERIVYQALALLLLSSLAFFFLRKTDISLIDPDRYYHLGLTRHMAETHQIIPRTLPQVKGLGWDKKFVDKEFLFHQLTLAAYHIGGEKAVIGAITFVGLICLILIFQICAEAAPLPAALAISVALSCNNYLLNRLSMLRPQVLAVLFFLLFTRAVLRRQPWLAFAAAALFCLSYHAFLFPALLAGCALLATQFLPEHQKSERKLVALSFLGLAIGTLANPYFPGNLVAAIVHMRIPGLIQHNSAGLDFGLELLPISALEFRNEFALQFLALLLAALSLPRILGPGESKADTQNRLLLALATAGFLVLTMQMPRVGEYLVPTSAILLASLYRLWDDQPRARTAVLGLICLYAAGIFTYKFNLAPSQEVALRDEARLSAARSIPGRNANVFSLDWASTPYFLFARPDLSFVDILDPSFLYFQDRELFDMRHAFTSGKTADPAALTRRIFHAEYVLGYESPAAEQLRHDPDFVEIFPSQATPKELVPFAPRIFRLADDSSAHFVKKFRVSFVKDADGANLREKKPGDANRPGAPMLAKAGTYLDLFSSWGKSARARDSKGDAYCALVRAESEELSRWQGATYIGIGGGRSLRLWRNGKPLYSSVLGFGTNRRLATLVPLAGGLKKGDELELLVCSAKEAPFWGAAISFWSESDLQTICERKRKSTGYDSLEPFPWPYFGTEGESCLGPIRPLPLDARR